MEHKIKFEQLPAYLQDELRDAPITNIENGKVVVETMSIYKDRQHQFTLELSPRNMTDTAVIYITQDLQGVDVTVTPIFQTLSA